MNVASHCFHRCIAAATCGRT